MDNILYVITGLLKTVSSDCVIIYGVADNEEVAKKIIREKRLEKKDYHISVIDINSSITKIGFVHRNDVKPFGKGCGCK